MENLHLFFRIRAVSRAATSVFVPKKKKEAKTRRAFCLFSIVFSRFFRAPFPGGESAAFLSFHQVNENLDHPFHGLNGDKFVNAVIVFPAGRKVGARQAHIG